MLNSECGMLNENGEEWHPFLFRVIRCIPCILCVPWLVIPADRETNHRMHGIRGNGETKQKAVISETAKMTR